jgi:excisionase family DNA binding protein
MTAENFDPVEWITTTEAAELTGYTDAYLRQLIGRDRLQAKKRGRDWFLSKADVLAYAKEMKRLGSAKFDPWRTGARQKQN